MDSVESLFLLDDLLPLTPLDDQHNNLTQNELRFPLPPPPPPPPPPIVAKLPLRRRRQTDRSLDNNVGKDTLDEQKKRKIIHKEVERQRRREMTDLYTSLRSQIPVDYLKGKRSVSDHMHEAVRYIKGIENKIRELSLKRDKLKQLTRDCSTALAETSQRRRSLVVKPSCVGVQVTAGFDVESELLPSKLVEALMEEGLQVISGTSTKMDGRLLHKVEAQVKKGGPINVHELEQKLSSLF